MSQTRQYELVYIVSPDASEQAVADLHTQVEQIIQRFNGTLDKTENWGRRKLAYEIDHKGEGSYHLLHFTCDAGTLDEVSRVLRIDDGVMRHMATRRIEGSPVRPVAVAAPSREDAGAASDVEAEEEEE